MIQNKTYLKNKFRNGNRPTQQDYYDLIDTVFYLTNNPDMSLKAELYQAFETNDVPTELDYHNLIDSAFYLLSSNVNVDWIDVTNKPTEFNPTTHNHNDLYYIKSEIDNILNNLVNTLNNKYFREYTFPSAPQWVVVHDLHIKRPSVTVTDDSGNVFDTEIQYINDTTIHINFDTQMSGKVYLS